MTEQSAATLKFGENGEVVEIPQDIVDSVRRAVNDTFTQICGEKPIYEQEQYKPPCNGIVGIISFVGDRCWVLMLGQPRETAISLAKTFAGFEIPFESADMGDAVGELTNVLAGSVTAHMENAGFKVQMSLPTAARGTDVELLLGGGLPSTFIPFTTPNGSCWIRLVMAKPRK